MSSDKLRAPGGVQVACFWRGDACARRTLPWLLPWVGGGGLCARQAPSPPWVSPPPKSLKNCTLRRRFWRWRHLGQRRPPLAARAAVSIPGKGAGAPPPCAGVPTPKKCSFAFRVRVFATLGSGSGRRFRRTWICCTFLSGAFWRLGNWQPLTKILLSYVLLSASYGRRKMRCLQIMVAALLPPITTQHFSGLPSHKFRKILAWTKNVFYSPRYYGTPCICIVNGL
jgi:hypothetical protein